MHNMPVMFPVAECVGFHTFFGKIRDSNITFVIDTSESMICHLDTIKKHLCEALLSKAYSSSNSLFNIIGFSHKVTKWCDRMVTCSPNVVLNAMDWIRSLVCMPGRDLLQALIAALDDPLCQAVYLVTDGLPINNLEETVQVVSCMSQGRPLHIFFLSEKHFDHDVQDYLHELARYTRGSCHLITLSAGEIKQVIPTYTSECSNTGPFYSDLKYCSAKATMAPCVYMDSHQCCSGQVCSPCHATRRVYQLCPVSVCENADFIEGSLDSRHLATGTQVLARREPDGFYYLGSIKQEIEVSCKFRIVKF
ncbi:uncharacterized protein C11orf16 homolog [Erpetoichthys calabaricus]|uniref:uncharacterized protein C11orf16 homolog n=1 Tax=Erpetoichthys calabaricus TaxID=27687 RepID=UPI0022347AD0|nr:uncharacterized protein C11orf16 homolog [Erpetoichthys calabaricus]